jgi:hypothetical protein
MKKTSKLIFSPQLAKYLIQCGFRVIDLKSNHNNSGEVVFVFAYENGLDEQMTI